TGAFGFDAAPPWARDAPRGPEWLTPCQSVDQLPPTPPRPPRLHYFRLLFGTSTMGGEGMVAFHNGGHESIHVDMLGEGGSAGGAGDPALMMAAIMDTESAAGPGRMAHMRQFFGPDPSDPSGLMDAPSFSIAWEGPNDDGSDGFVSMRGTRPMHEPPQGDSCTAGDASNMAPWPVAQVKVLPGCTYTVQFDAYGSSDLDGMVVRSAWTFGDEAGGTGAQIEHLYAGPGVYRVGLTVWDDMGVSSSAAGFVRVPPCHSP
ncbi:MAG: PKD domain-containing protein, partial [Halobacteriales archaeon]|nr:PKD domain-containing protein [Halobacteriales archaeon]